ncbi:MAG TPA: M56 family metallopeptidase [Pirellulales bacterium]|nr:M56 family metallopeptidase [Pirellulales bacterium]
MNALGIVLIWTALQVTLFCLMGAVAYLIARRRHSLWGAAMLCGVLVTTVGIAALAISPWPRWLTISGFRWREQSSASPIAATGTMQRDSMNAPGVGSGDTAFANAEERSTLALNFLAGIWGEVRGELADESGAELQNRSWRWPAWLAAAALSAMALGLARVLLGLVILARLLRGTHRVTDPAMTGLIEQLHARLHCRRPVELRELPAGSAGGSPATVGWRRPIILLPADWPSWSADARRGILAHEIAHVAHGDLWMRLAAQAGVIVHFYNPLVHWLAARLRLEQELAADARGAAMLGGARTYATVLARMALLQDDAQPLWAGCPFFRTRGTLMRRIEMLDNEKRKAIAEHAPSRIAQTGLLMVLVIVGAAVAGLRGPLDAARADDPVPKAEPAETAKGDVNHDLPPAFDASYLPAETIAVVSFKSLTMANSIVTVEPVFNLPPNMIGFGFLPADKDKVRPWSVEEIKMVVLRSESGVASPPKASDSAEPPMLIIYRFRGRHDQREWRDRISEDATGAVTETTVRGLPCFQVTGKVADDSVNYLLPDDRTIVVVRQRDIARVLAADSRRHPSWYDRWVKMADNPLSVAVDSALVTEFDSEPTDAVDKLLVATLRESEMVFAQLVSTAGGLEMHATALCQSPEKAAAAARIVTDSVALGLTAVPQVFAPSLLPSLLPKEYQSLDFVGPLAQTLASAAVNVKETQVHIEAKLDGGFAAQFIEATKAYNDALGKADEQAHLANLGRLAKAFAAYHAAHGHYPPAAVMGPDGKTVHSWRVELLPYLGEQKLFDEYKLDQPWDSEHNQQLVERIPEIYHTTASSNKGKADYYVVTGQGTLFDGNALASRESIADAPGETILVLQSRQRAPWTKPVDVDPRADRQADQPIRGLGHGFYAAFADGTVKFVSKDTDPSSVRAMFTKAGGDRVKLR